MVVFHVSAFLLQLHTAGGYDSSPLYRKFQKRPIPRWGYRQLTLLPQQRLSIKANAGHFPEFHGNVV